MTKEIAVSETQVPTVAELLAAGLKRHGIRTVFGQSIPSAFHLAAGDLGINQVVYRTENAGAIMADAFARISRTIGVVTAQNGPAATLLVPGLAEAFKASVPILALVQDVPLSMTDKNAFQEYDHLELFRSCAKWVRRLTEGGRVNELSRCCHGDGAEPASGTRGAVGAHGCAVEAPLQGNAENR